MKKFFLRLNRIGLLALAILIFGIDVGTNIYTNLQASDDNFAKDRDEKIASNRETPEAIRLRFLADSIAAISLRNSNLMVENNSTAVKKVKSGERKKAELWSNEFIAVVNSAANADRDYKAYLDKEDEKAWDEYNRKMKRKEITSLTGAATGLAVGILSPIFSCFLMIVSVRPYDDSFRLRCIIGAYAAQLISSIITGIALYLMFGNVIISIGFAFVLLWCAPLLYESVARERQRLANELQSKKMDEIAEKERELAEKESEIARKENESKIRNQRKIIAEQSRVRNLLNVANRLVNDTKSNPFKKISTDPEKAAEWFVQNGEPYGFQIRLAAHCGETKSTFNRLVEQKRGEFSSQNGNGKLNGKH